MNTTDPNAEFDVPSTPPRGEQAGRYELFDEIGTGGMASVHIGRLLGPSGFARTVAVKRPLPAVARDDRVRRMVINEARMASRVHHPNVVATLDVVENGSDALIVMEYVHGESLALLMSIAQARGERIPVPIAAALLVAALRGLSAVHQARDEQGRPLGLIHRDVSPQNILCGADGLARLSDFGLAKAAGDANLTGRGEFMGKLTYASPEQVELRPLTQATDIYSMGLVLWELLVGERLYEGLTSPQIVARLLHDSVLRTSQHNADVPPPLDDVVDRAVRRDPSARFGSAVAMASAIEDSGALASIAEVAAWVRELASDRLANRERLVMTAERKTTPSRRGARRGNAVSTTHLRIAAASGSRLPSANDQPARVRGSSAAMVAPALGLLAGVALGVAVVGWWHASRGKPPPVAASTAAAVVPASDAPVPSASFARAAASSSASTTAASIPTPAVAATLAPAALEMGGGPSASEREPRNLPNQKLAREQPDCLPPFSLDSEGIRHMKPGCR